MAAGDAALGLVVTGAGTRGVLWLTGPLLVTGIGMGMLTAPLTGIVLAQVAPQHVGTVSGLQSTTVQLGNSLGVAVIGVPPPWPSRSCRGGADERSVLPGLVRG